MSKNMEAVRVFWEQEAQRDPIPQGWSNDAPLMVWEDKERSLRFEWDGDATHNISVIWDNRRRFLSFDFRHFKPNWIVAGTKSAVLCFHEACRHLIDSKEEIAETEGAIR